MIKAWESEVINIKQVQGENYSVDKIPERKNDHIAKALIIIMVYDVSQVACFVPNAGKRLFMLFLKQF